MSKSEYVVAHMGTGEVLEVVAEVTDKKALLERHFERLYPNRKAPRAFMVGRAPSSKLVMAPLVCL